ncbi:MAG TPA: hypothetical protein VK177_19125 [Flavobacteriales bacterium]|nr:hypothetical protein [Flavobacteriales bacterium]
MNDKQRLSAYQKINKGLEYFWLVITVAAAIMATWFITQEGYDQGKWYLLFPLLALAMYVMRRGLRKKFEASLKRALEEQQAQKKKGKPA